MENTSEYDERQLQLMYKNLISFEKNQIDLNSLVGTLEFLLNALKSVNCEWEEKFLKEINLMGLFTHQRLNLSDGFGNRCGQHFTTRRRYHDIILNPHANVPPFLIHPGRVGRNI